MEDPAEDLAEASVEAPALTTMPPVPVTGESVATEPDAPSPEDGHLFVVQCPRCGTTFGHDSEPPARVKCPTCGKRGRI